LKNGTLLPRERVYIDSSSVSQDSLQLYGFAYQIISPNANAGTWLPANPFTQKRELEYTIWTKNVSNCGIIVSNKEIPENIGSVFKIYPNPTDFNQTLKYNLDKSCGVTITLFNILGQKIKTIFSGTCNLGENEVDIPLYDQKSGTYFLQVKLNYEESHTIRLIKL
jgi:hypothetical protein